MLLNDKQGQFVLNTATFFLTQLHVALSLALSKRGPKKKKVDIMHVPRERFEKSIGNLLGGAKRTMNHGIQQQISRAVVSMH